MNITFNGAPMTLLGEAVKVGDKLKDFTVTANDLSALTLADTKGVRIFLTVPSLDTPVCDLEVRSFNKRMGELAGVEVWTVSMDLPFAQMRWCGAAGVQAVKTASDYKTRSFAAASGTMIEELGLLTRAVFVLDSSGTVTYVEYVPEVTTQPDFDAVFAHVKSLMG